MIDVVPLTLDHVRMLSDPVTEPGLKKISESIPSYWETVCASGRASAGFLNGEFLGCGGYGQPWPGVAEAWIWVMPQASKYPQGVHKFIKRSIRSLVEEHNLHRISVVVREDNARARRWMSLLGFELEGILRRAGPDGANYAQYARVE